jgi:hypothetical protein
MDGIVSKGRGGREEISALENLVQEIEGACIPAEEGQFDNPFHDHLVSSFMEKPAMEDRRLVIFNGKVKNLSKHLLL